MLRSFITSVFFATTIVGSATGIAQAETKSLVIAGGCFWCVESDLDHVKGVTGTTSGYGGGRLDNPTYKNHGDHREVVKVDYDSTQTDYKTLITTFIRTIDPTDGGGQFCDRGHSYSPAIFAATPDELMAAKQVVGDAGKQLGKKMKIAVEGKASFFAAEDYHQNYYLGKNRVLTRFGLIKQSDAYKRYREGCGRDARVKAVWGHAAYEGVTAH